MHAMQSVYGITPQGYTKYYYSGKEHVATQIGNVSHMQAQFTQSDTIAGMISKSNTFMQCYGEISSGWGMTSATNIPAKSGTRRLGMTTSAQGITRHLLAVGCRLIR